MTEPLQCALDSSIDSTNPTQSANSSPKKKHRKRHEKPRITVPETEPSSPERRPMHIRLSQRHSTSEETSDNTHLGHLRRSCNNPTNYTIDETAFPADEEEDKQEDIQMPVETVAGCLTTSTGVDIPNVQPEKYVLPPHTETSNPETEDTYVDYCITSLQGGGDNPQYGQGSPKKSVDGTYSLVANTLKLSTV